MLTISRLTTTLSLLFLCGLAVPAAAQDKVLNLYSARHYQTDEALYANFTKATGIRINRIEGAEDPLLERIRNEGANSPADVFITVDAGRLWRADQLDLFLPVKSAQIENRIPASFRMPDGHWFGFSARARVIVYNKDFVKAADIQNYEDLADPKMKGNVCVRSGGHVYNLSLVAALIEHWGEARTEQWARGVVANFARDPKGGDTDQIRAVGTGECRVALVNTYYYVRMMKSDKPDDRKLMEKLALVWPNQKSFGTHLNVSGGGILKTAPNKEAAIRFLEYLASDEAQVYFANGNNEWPVVKTAALKNPELTALGNFKADSINVAALGKNQPAAQKLLDRAGWR